MAEQRESASSRFWTWLGRVSDLQTLLTILGSSALTTAVLTRVPQEWRIPQTWAAAVLTFSGSLVLFRCCALALRRVRKLIRPPATRLEVTGGLKTSITIHHSGTPDSYSATGRITRLSSDNANPAPAQFEAQLLFKGGKPGTELTLRDGEWALIVGAELIPSALGGRDRVEVRRGGLGTGVSIPDSGATLEYTISRGATVVAVVRYAAGRAPRAALLAVSQIEMPKTQAVEATDFRSKAHWTAHIALLVLLAILGRAVVRLENFHYAAFVGMCEDVPNPLVRNNLTADADRHTCLHETATRTGPLWHLYYALTSDQ